MCVSIREFTVPDLDDAISLWEGLEEVELSPGDAKGSLARYLSRNEGSSFIACDGERLVGAVLAGDDGRRGYLYHLAVHPAYRGQGIGSSLFGCALEALSKRGIRRCHVFVYPWNKGSKRFLAKHGFRQGGDFIVLSKQMNGRRER